MPRTSLTKEVIITVPNKVGTFAKVTSTLAEGRVNIEACCCYTQDGNTANLHFVNADPAKTSELFKKGGWIPKENPIVCCELNNQVGTLAEAANKLGQAGVDIEYCYTSTGNGNTTKVFFATKDNNKAVKTLG